MQSFNQSRLYALCGAAIYITDFVFDLRESMNNCEKELIKYLMNNDFTSFMKEKYRTREDKGNIFPVGISDAEFREWAIDYLLGRDWYVVDPLSTPQTNEIALEKILKKYSKEYRKEVKRYARLENKADKS